MSGKLNRRKMMLGIGGASAAAVLLGTGAWRTAAADTRLRGGYPFSLGVASGDPLPDGVVLWTRLAPEPLAADGSGGMPDRPVQVRYEVATDEQFRDVVRRGAATATPELAHSVHAEVSGLEPAREYFYRFRTGSELSPVGRTKTAPAAGAALASLSFAFASCQQWKAGFYTAYQHMAAEDLDLVVHLGDYIYEDDQTANKRGVALGDEFKPETETLGRYRLQYSLFKSDPHLQAAHALFPWVVTMDDHEVENNWADEISENNADPALFRQRRAAAFQALYENQPVRRSAIPQGPDIRLHRRLQFGDLADLTMIDTRQYRDDQPCGDGTAVDCAERLDPNRTILGAQQRQWLLDGFANSRARWQILGNQAPMGETDLDAGPAKELYMDPWDGYVADRNAVLTGAVDRGVRNLVVITGDRHQNYAWDLKKDFEDPNSSTVASEFVGTSITSGGNGADMTDDGRTLLAANPHMKFFNSQRGYVRCTVTPQTWRSDYRVIPFIEQPDAPVSTRATYVVEHNHPGVQPA
ncbi:alkaline phosphatase D family protein [Saccharopolyspora sp. 5N708]|uniref:alkaline phosphatase D family protein n=1 Tax=Saccharopolyspora sp. 5N708 TaxID=3457424 RepID=UPI003FD34C01